MFISFCGIDGCGKTTQSNILQELLPQIGIKDIQIIHGFKPPVYSGELKKIAMDMGKDFHELFSQDIRSLSFILDLIEITVKTILPALNEGGTIIAEKYYLDTLVYSPLLGGDTKLLEFFKKCIPEPDLYLLLDLPADEAFNRVQQRSVRQNIQIAPKENIDISKLAKKEFILYAEKNPAQCIVIDAMQTPSVIGLNCLNVVSQFLKKEVEV